MPNVKYAKVLDTRLEAVSSNDICYVVEQGANVVNYTPLVSSSHSNQNTTFNLNNIADVTCRQSRIVMGATVTLTLSMTNSSNVALDVVNADNFGFKQFPLNRCMTSIQHQINQASYTLNSYDILDAITKLNYNSPDMNFFENTQPDSVDSYANATGTLINPIASYASSIQGEGIFKPRSLNYTISGNSIPANSTGTCVITCNLYEPLITPFTDVSSKDTRGLYAITGELINISYVSDLYNNMFAFVPQPGLTVASSVVDLGATSKLYTVYLTPKEETVSQIPRESVYQYIDYSTSTVKVADSVPAGSAFQSSSQVVNFTNLPSKILVYARISNAYRTVSTPDKYLAINSLSVTFDNGQPQLSNTDLDGNQIWEVSNRNGLSQNRASFQQARLNNGVAGFTGDLYGSGGVMVIDPSLDLGIRSGMSAGSPGRFVFQVTCNFQNKTATDFPECTLYVVGLTNAILERVGSQYRNYLLTTPVNIINEVANLPPISHAEWKSQKSSNSFLGGAGVGDWFKKAWGQMKAIPHYITSTKDIINDGRAILNTGRELAKVARGGAHKGRSSIRQPVAFTNDIRPARNEDMFFD